MPIFENFLLRARENHSIPPALRPFSSVSITRHRSCSFNFGEFGDMKIHWRKSCSRAFTVLELFVVVVVVFLLAALILPALHPACACIKANCVNNLKQTGLSF